MANAVTAHCLGAADWGLSFAFRNALPHLMERFGTHGIISPSDRNGMACFLTAHDSSELAYVQFRFSSRHISWNHPFGAGVFSLWFSEYLGHAACAKAAETIGHKVYLVDDENPEAKLEPDFHIQFPRVSDWAVANTWMTREAVKPWLGDSYPILEENING